MGNLLELYIHDFSELRDVDLGPDGRFGYRLLPLYWSDPDRHAFLIRIDGKLAGFALVKRGSELSGNKAVWDMGEFFVIRGHRRRGFGTQVMHELWRRLPGLWEIRVMQSNVPRRLRKGDSHPSERHESTNGKFLHKRSGGAGS